MGSAICGCEDPDNAPNTAPEEKSQNTFDGSSSGKKDRHDTGCAAEESNLSSKGTPIHRRRVSAMPGIEVIDEESEGMTPPPT